MNWKPEKYGGIQTIRVPPNQVWTPDVKHIFKKKDISKNKKKTKIFRLFYLIMLMVNMKHHLNLMLLFILMVI
jgi:hypothetical protein